MLRFLLCRLFALSSLFCINSLLAVMPTFDRSTDNVTIIIGNAAVLPCFINNLGDHKVAWIKVTNMDILAIGDYKVTNDDRIKLLHGYLSDWSLSIQPVNEEDAGEYICQINTEPQMITRINLKVLLPPKIIEEKSTISPGPVREGHALKIHCHSEGVPTPKVSWYFRKRFIHHSSPGMISRNGHHIEKINPKADQVIHEGDTLVINNVTRLHSGIFECIANNSVPPAASRKIKVSIEFPPEIQVVTNKVEQFIGQDARFECRIKAHPLINFYWMKNDQLIENSLVHLDNSVLISESAPINNNFVERKSVKYESIVYNQNSNDYLTVIALVVKNLNKSDFDTYSCFAVNAYNKSRADVELKEVTLRRASSSTKHTVSKIFVYNNVNPSNDRQNSQYDVNESDLNSLSHNSRAKYNNQHHRKANNGSALRKSTQSKDGKMQNLEEDDYYDETRTENSLSLFNGGQAITIRRCCLFNLVFITVAVFLYRF